MDQTLYRAVLDKLAPRDAYHMFIRLIAQMDGFRTRLEEIHWATKSMSTHKLVDDIQDALKKHQDSIAEDLQGEFGDIEVGTIRPLLPVSEELVPLLKEMKYELVVLPLNCIEGDLFTGLKSELEGFYHKLNVFIYLANKSED
jgi:hypothetical protein